MKEIEVIRKVVDMGAESLNPQWFRSLLFAVRDLLRTREELQSHKLSDVLHDCEFSEEIIEHIMDQLGDKP